MNYVLAISSALPLLMVAARHFDRFNRLFAIISFLFALAFYCFPLAYAADAGYLSYGGITVPFSVSDRNSALLAMLIFSSGFLACDFFRPIRKISLSPPRQKSGGGMGQFLSTAFPLVIYAVSIYLVYYLITSDFYEYSRQVRMNVTDGDYLVTTILLSFYYINCLLLIINLKNKKYYSAVFSFLLALLLIINFGGRVQVGIVLLIPIVHFIRRQGLLIAVGVIGGVIGLPIILQGKAIIAVAAIGGNVLDAVRASYSENLDPMGILNNFSHPFVSFYYSPVLISDLGYRLFWDIPQGFLFYLKLLGLNFGDSLTYYNTEIILSKRESIVPPGYLAFGFVQANYFGVFIMGGIFRLTGYLAEVVKRDVGEGAPAADFFLAFLAANTFYIGEVRGLVLTFLFPCALLYIVTRLTGGGGGFAVSRNGDSPRRLRVSRTGFAPPPR